MENLLFKIFFTLHVFSPYALTFAYLCINYYAYLLCTV